MSNSGTPSKPVSKRTCTRAEPEGSSKRVRVQLLGKYVLIGVRAIVAVLVVVVVVVVVAVVAVAVVAGLLFVVCCCLCCSCCSCLSFVDLLAAPFTSSSSPSFFLSCLA